MRILVVSQYYWPENFRINDLTEELVKRGHEITILTGQPNYPSGAIYPEYKANPNAFNEYKGCQIVRVPIVVRGTSKHSLLMNYLSYPVMASSIGLWRLRKADFDVVFICQLSPILLALPGVIYKIFYKKPIVMWVLDLWPDSLESVGVVKSPKLLSVVGSLVKFIYKRCDLILGQSKAFYNGIKQFCDNEKKIKYFPSWSESIFSESQNLEARKLKGLSSFKVLFAGNIGEAQDFPSILIAAEIIKKQKANVQLIIVGDGRAYDEVRKRVKQQGLSDIVLLLGRFPLQDMPAFYAESDALLVTLKESKAFSMTIPGKVQTYMAAGKPILTMLSGEGSRVVDEANCGLTAKSGDSEMLAKNIMDLSCYSKDELYILGKNAKDYARNEFDRDKLISQLESWFEEIATKEGRLS